MVLSSIALEECIRSYEREIARKNSLESKASTLLNTSAIVVTILNSFIAIIISKIIILDNVVILIALNILALIFILFSIFMSFDVLKIQNYFTPFKLDDPNRMNEILEDETLNNDLLDRYLSIIPQIHLLNNNKVVSLESSRRFLIFGLLLSFLSLIISFLLSGF